MKKNPDLSIKNTSLLNHYLIEGDNINALKTLQQKGVKVDIIYIDPPYNTGNKYFVYNDSKGRDEWLSFMKDRLVIAHDLMNDDALFFASIDDKQQAYLKILLDEVFGESNFLSTLIWEKAYSPKNNSKLFSSRHEYIHVYSKNKSTIIKVGLKGLPRNQAQDLLSYKYDDNDGRGPYRSNNLNRYGGHYYDYNGMIDGLPQCPKSGWGLTYDKMKSLEKDNRVFQSSPGTRIRLKTYLSEVKKEIVPETILFCSGYSKVGSNYFSRQIVGPTQEGTKEVNELVGINKFNYPKPVSLINHLIGLSKNKNAVVLDFFAGSGTTGHSVIDLNRKDGGERQFILCNTNENNICREVTRERLSKVMDQDNLIYFVV